MLGITKICSGNLKYVANGKLHNDLLKKNALFGIFAFIFAWMILYALLNGVLGQSLPIFLPLYFSALYLLFLIWMTSDTRELCGDFNFASIILLVLLFVSLISIIFRENVLTTENLGLATKSILFSSMAVLIPRRLLFYSHHMLRKITTLISPFIALYLMHMIFSGNTIRFGLSLNINYNIAAFSSLTIAYLISCRYVAIEFILRIPFLVYAILSGSKKFAVLGILLIFFDLVSIIIRKSGRVVSLLLITSVILLAVNYVSIPTSVTDGINWQAYINRFYVLDSSVDNRIDRIDYHLNNIENAPFLGAGDVSYSAHNIIIQAWSEGGLLHGLSSLFVIMLLLLMLIHTDVNLSPYIILSIAFLVFGDHYYWDRLLTLYLLLFIPFHFGKIGISVVPTTLDVAPNLSCTQFVTGGPGRKVPI